MYRRGKDARLPALELDLKFSQYTGPTKATHITITHAVPRPPDDKAVVVEGETHGRPEGQGLATVSEDALDARDYLLPGRGLLNLRLG